MLGISIESSQFTPATKNLNYSRLKLSSQSLLSRKKTFIKSVCSVKTSLQKRVGFRHVCQAINTEDSAEIKTNIYQPIPEPVLVAGASGGVGQLVVAALLDCGSSVRALVRNAEKASALFGVVANNKLKIVGADLRNTDSLKGDVLEGIRSVIVCTGTTAFPSKRWDGDNGPVQTDVVGNKNLLAALPSSVERIIFVSSVGVTRFNQFPYNILNLFGVLKCKREAEEMVESSGIPFTIIRPGRLTDGPYTSYDLNTLLKATSGIRRSAIIERGDTLTGEASRILVAQACVQCLSLPATVGMHFSINSTEGDGPGKDKEKWEVLFRNAQ